MKLHPVILPNHYSFLDSSQFVFVAVLIDSHPQKLGIQKGKKINIMFAENHINYHQIMWDKIRRFIRCMIPRFTNSVAPA